MINDAGHWARGDVHFTSQPKALCQILQRSMLDNELKICKGKCLEHGETLNYSKLLQTSNQISVRESLELSASRAGCKRENALGAIVFSKKQTKMLDFLGSDMFGWHHQLNGHDSEQTLGDSEGQGRLACCIPWGRRESDMTNQLNNDNRALKPKVRSR